jgi:hypothetical protein
MTEVREHLRKRAEEARKKAEANAAAAAGEPAGEPAAAGETAAPAAEGGGASKIPAHLLERSRAAKEKAAAGGGGEGGGGAVATVTAAPIAAAGTPPPAATGPGGHTQRLLTVVKSGSIQDVKALPQDKVHTWPHLLVVEFAAALACTAFLLFFAMFVNAPLLQLANPNETPNPAKAPWYFLGLQELLTMFHPMVAGVLLPGMVLMVLILAPYIDKNPSNKPEDRKFAIAMMTVHLMMWAVLVMIGSFFRGPGQNFVFPWNKGLFFDL